MMKAGMCRGDEAKVEYTLRLVLKNRYKLIRQIREGRYGVVWFAHDI